MIPTLVALPLLATFFVSLLETLRVKERKIRIVFLAGILSPWVIFIYDTSKMPLSEIVGNHAKEAGIQVSLDIYNFYFILAELILFSLVAVYSMSYFNQRSKNGKIYALLLLMHAGLLGAFISRDLFNYYIYMEVASVSSFALIGLSDEKGAKKAAYKYLAFSLVASYLFIFAIGIIYLKTGYLNVELIKDNVVISREINIALSVAFSTLILKAGIFPLHFWLPDAHSKAPTPISALLSGIVVKAPIYGMLLLYVALPIEDPLLRLLRLVAFSSMLIGVILALLQKNAKRLLAYHTVSQMGYVLLGVATLNPLGVIYYAFAHTLFKGGLFLSVGTLINAQKTKNLEKLTYRYDKILMASIIMLSLAIGGISPFVGAFGKKLLLSNLSGIQRHLFYTAGIGTLVSFTKLNYYLMKPKKAAESNLTQRVLSFTVALLTLAFGVYFGLTVAYKDLFAISIAILGFLVLKKAGTLNIIIKKHFGDGIEGVGMEVNVYMTGFLLFLLLLLLQSF
ncbi:proton-conducting transporter membrane subunit [Thermococcus sp. LS2]|uniref:proton-conducting transporter transmembrane domain-containing protein n=1 Tax=Thermococcus sp. LS2 TaxID=1638260 RepID=UPI001439F307|nr:proton-conducting transporter membrane subunit [Thermococcus sp. LS2]NJE13133.1 monovalent cation/H+ antiporter subunit D family protein [Thermococcus sp. LS2]